VEQGGTAITRCPFVLYPSRDGFSRASSRASDKFSRVNNRLLLVLALAAVCPLSGAGQQRAEAPPAPAALSDFFKPGVVFQDRNGDGATDFVDARIVLPEQPSSGELAAAADIAARLGYETSAMNLPVTVARGYQPAETPTIFVGAKSLAGSRTTVESLGAANLKAGDGAVAAFTQGGRPAVAVLGGDDNGIASAAVMLAGHLPYLWDQKSPTTDKIADDVKQFLTGKGVTASTATATTIFTRAGAADGVDRLAIALQMANGGDFVKAMVALNQFKATSARDSKRPLSYASVRALQIAVRAPGSGPVTIELPRVAASDQAPPQAPARRPGGGAKEAFDLSSFYANEGALADSDNNLIPDRVDVLLSAEGDGSEGIIDLAERLPEIKDMLSRSLRGDVETRVGGPRRPGAGKVDPGELELALIKRAVKDREGSGAVRCPGRAVQIGPLLIVRPVVAACRHDRHFRRQVLQDFVTDPFDGPQRGVVAGYAGQDLRIRLERGCWREGVVRHLGQVGAVGQQHQQQRRNEEPQLQQSRRLL